MTSSSSTLAAARCPHSGACEFLLLLSTSSSSPTCISIMSEESSTSGIRWAGQETRRCTSGVRQDLPLSRALPPSLITCRRLLTGTPEQDGSHSERRDETDCPWVRCCTIHSDESARSGLPRERRQNFRIPHRSHPNRCGGLPPRVERTLDGVHRRQHSDPAGSGAVEGSRRFRSRAFH